jgi:serine/threonine protein kinase
VRQRPCLDDDEVQALALGALSAEAATPMLEHVGTCDVCRVLVATLARRPTPPLWDADTLPASGAGAAPVLSQGARIDRYVVEDHVGQGGMGVVYAAYDPQLDRRVALKVVRSDRAQSLELRQRLVREAQVMARVSHPNVVTVYDAGIVDDQVFIAMELVDGSTLTEWLRAEPRSWRQVVEPFADAGRGLAAAHAIGIVHRDFKPDNVLVGKDGRVRVSDFGLAIAEASPEATANAGAPRAGGGAARLTGDGRLVGTPAYMAPEQRSGGVIDARTDQFSFCVALHEALFGVLPGGAGPPAAREPRARGRVPREVRRVIARGLSPSPAARFPSMDALLDRLGRCAAPPRRPTAALFGALALTALIGAGATSTFVRHARREAAPHAFARSVHRLTYSPGCEEYPSFVSKSSVLVFDGDVDGAQQLFTLDVATRAVRQLTVGPAAHRAAVVSPDGRRAVYEHKLDGPREIRLMELDGHGEER